MRPPRRVGRMLAHDDARSDAQHDPDARHRDRVRAVEHERAAVGHGVGDGAKHLDDAREIDGHHSSSASTAMYALTPPRSTTRTSGAVRARSGAGSSRGRPSVSRSNALGCRDSTCRACPCARCGCCSASRASSRSCWWRASRRAGRARTRANGLALQHDDPPRGEHGPSRRDEQPRGDSAAPR